MNGEDTKQQALFSEYPDIVNVEQLSTMLGISTKTAYKLLKEEKRAYTLSYNRQLYAHGF